MQNILIIKVSFHLGLCLDFDLNKYGFAYSFSIVTLAIRAEVTVHPTGIPENEQHLPCKKNVKP
ncbi:MAG: hypothetical protein K5696_11885 [Lachnospiraceae bacterium]|nr:hypothetical protein [Lachnospiraceae bacterium]